MVATKFGQFRIEVVVGGAALGSRLKKELDIFNRPVQPEQRFLRTARGQQKDAQGVSWVFFSGGPKTGERFLIASAKCQCLSRVFLHDLVLAGRRGGELHQSFFPASQPAEGQPAELGDGLAEGTPSPKVSILVSPI